MNTARVELCRELYTLSRWVLTEKHWYQGKPIYNAPYGWDCPAYDLGFLLEKLPKSVTEFWGRAYPASPCLMYSGTQWVIFYQSEMTGEHNTDELFGQFADTPEDAACSLCVELFKQDILEKV